MAICRAQRHQRAQQQYEQKLHAVKDAVRAWMHRAGENRALHHLTSHRSRVDRASAEGADGAATNGHGSPDVPTANGPRRLLSRGPSFRKTRSAAAAAAVPAAGAAGVADGSVEPGDELQSTPAAAAAAVPAAGAGGREPGDELRLLVNSMVGQQPSGQGGGHAGQGAAVAGESRSITTRPTGDRDNAAVQLSPLRGERGGGNTGTSGVGVPHGGFLGQGEVKAAAANDKEGHGAFHSAESMKIIDAAVEALAAAMLVSGDGERLGRNRSERHHHAHLGVGAARLIPRADSWSTVSTVGGDDPVVDRGLDQHERLQGVDVGGAGRWEGVRGRTAAAAAAGAMAAVSDGDDDTPTGLKAMEAGRSRFTFQQQQQQRGGQQGSRLSSSGGRRGGEKDPMQGVDYRQQGGMNGDSGGPSSPVVDRSSVGGRSEGIGKDTMDGEPSSPRLDGVDPSWWGSR